MASIPQNIPELSDVIRTLIDNALVDLNVCMPGKVVKYDPSKQYASVQPLPTQSFIDGSAKPFPVIPLVPVKWPRANGKAMFIHMPLSPGDDVVLVFSQRSLDNWKISGGVYDPDDYRMHHATDCYALVGGSAMPDSFQPSTTDSIEIVNGESSVIVQPGGTFKVKNNENELIDVLNQIATQVQTFVQTISTDTTNTSLGPMMLNKASQYATIASELETLQGKLATLKGS